MLNWIDVNRTFAELDQFRREMDRLFESTVRNEMRGGGRALSDYGTGNANLEAFEDEFVLTADVPGVDPSDVDLQVTGDSVTLRVEREVEPPEGYTPHRQERGNWRMSRSWTLSAPINADKVDATVDKGVLTVHLPKSDEATPRRITVKS